MDTFYSQGMLDLFDMQKTFISEKKSKFIIVKHFNTAGLQEDTFALLEQEYPAYHCHYTSMDGSEMIGAYEPFVSALQAVVGHDLEETIEEIVSKIDIYPLLKPLFISMLEGRKLRRNERILLDEADYEREQLDDAFLQLFEYICKRKTMIIVINNLNLVSFSTITLLKKLLEKGNENLYLFAAYNEMFTIPPYKANVWENFVDLLEEGNYLVDGGTGLQEYDIEQRHHFHYQNEKQSNYIKQLYEMYLLLDFNQAQYYASLLFRKMELEEIKISKEAAFNFYLVFSIIYIHTDLSQALFFCEKAQFILPEDVQSKFDFYMNYARALMYSNNKVRALQIAKMCAKYAKELDEDCRILAQLIEKMIHMSGWHNVFFIEQDIDTPPEFMQALADHGYLNHLAYIYIFAHDNDVEELRKYSLDNEKGLMSFQNGIELAKVLKNEFLLKKAYRKNIMLASSNGLFHIADHYYYLSMELLRDSDPRNLADVYNGLGYNCCATEKYEEANWYYNKAIQLFYQAGAMDYVGETLYNMAMNCILAGYFDVANQYLLTAMWIIRILHMNDLRVCNISKIYGLLALCSFHLGLYYNARVQLENMNQFLMHIMDKQEDAIRKNKPQGHYAWDDDFFLYYYVNGMLAGEVDHDLKKARDYMDKASVFEEHSVGNQFFSKTQFKISYAKLLMQMGLEDEAKEQLQEGIDYALSHNAFEQKHRIEGIMYHVPFEQKHDGVDKLHGVSLNEIKHTTKQVALQKDYEELCRKQTFISIWQKMIETTGKTITDLVDTALNSFMSNYNMDECSYIRIRKGKPEVLFTTEKNRMTDDNIATIIEYFTTHRAGFVTSKLRKDHLEFSRVLNIFSMSEVCSMVCLPYYDEEQLVGVFITYILMKDNWSAPKTKYMLDESDHEFFNLLMQQLQNAVEKLEQEEQIRKINHSLEQAAVTDYLTGMNNREGFFAKVREWIKGSDVKDMTFLYIDLDNFKFYNDTFGHDIGDLILKQVAELIIHNAKNEGVASRFGGDEFVILLPYVDEKRAMRLGNKILSELIAKKGYANEIEAAGVDDVNIPKEKLLSCSIGIAALKDACAPEQISTAIKHADEVLYSIKHSTKGAVKYWQVEEPDLV